MKLVRVQDVVNGLKAELGNQMFQVVFTKKSDGTERRILGRFGVTKDLKGGTLKYDPTERGLMIMWATEACRRNDGKDNGYRAIPVLNIKELSAKGHKYVCKNGVVVDVK